MREVLKDIWIALQGLFVLVVVGGMVHVYFRIYRAIQPPKKSDIQTLFPKK
jgi:hypothetical protein